LFPVAALAFCAALQKRRRRGELNLDFLADDHAFCDAGDLSLARMVGKVPHMRHEGESRPQPAAAGDGQIQPAPAAAR